ncbi:hypothetical protein HMPREF9278_0139 [Mobiluncus mulieris FB024-16]|nr:hypothetical protein HMPREF9278_0139 [Mobiluncus mulieris FB024-16]
MLVKKIVMKNNSKYGGKTPHRASDATSAIRATVELDSVVRLENVPKPNSDNIVAAAVAT